MSNEINAQNELDLILKGMEEIDNRTIEEVEETPVEMKYLTEEDILEQIKTITSREEVEIIADSESEDEIELEADLAEYEIPETEETTEEQEVTEVEETTEVEEITEAIEVTEVDEPVVEDEVNETPATEEKTEKKGLFAGIFGSKKKDEQPTETKPQLEAELKSETISVTDETQKKIEELQEISAERLAILQKLSFEADEMRKQTLQLERHTLSLEEKTKQLTEEKEAMKKEADALESLLQEKYVRIEELEGMLRDPDVISGIGLEISSNDIRTIIRDILPDIKAMSTEAMVDFTLRVDDIYDPVVYCDRDRINSMIIKMIFCGLRYSNTGESLKFSISQKEPVASEYAEYIYSCVYKGDVVDFYSEEAAEMGGVVDIKRNEDGYVDMAVRFRFKIDIPELREKTLEFNKVVLEDYNLQ